MKKILVSLAVLGIVSLSASVFEDNKIACDNGEADGCYNLGLIYKKGMGVTQNYSKSKTAFKKSCDGGYAMGCNNLGSCYVFGHGVNPNKSEAIKFFKMACNLGAPMGCKNYNILTK